MKNAFRCAFRQVSLLFISLLLFNNLAIADSVPKGDPAKGEIVFKANCSGCHNVEGKLVGPGLKGVLSRWSNYDKLKDFVHNPSKYLDKDPYILKLQSNFGGARMIVPALSNEEVENVLAYVNLGSSVKPPVTPNLNNYLPIPTNNSLTKYLFFGVAGMFGAIFILAIRLLMLAKRQQSINAL